MKTATKSSSSDDEDEETGFGRVTLGDEDLSLSR